MTALRALLAGIVDYAGLFPPAALEMHEAVRKYAAYRASDDAWMLGRFVVPAGRLDELIEAQRATEVGNDAHRQGAAMWHLAATLGAAIDRDMTAVRVFHDTHDASMRIDAVEARADTPAAIARIGELTAGFRTFVEVPATPDTAILIDAVASQGLCAKLRTGGTAAEAFPSPEHVARFLHRCVAARVPFKATAGLHHPLRGRFRVTYEANAPTAPMFGFLNMFLAAALAATGADEAELVALLTDTRPAAFVIEREAITWNERRLPARELELLRDRVALSFGSCSFREPVDELRALFPAAAA